MPPVPKRLIQLGWLFVSTVLVLVSLASIAAAVRTVVSSAMPPTEPADLPTPPELPTVRPRATYAALSSSPVFGALTPSEPVVAKAPEPVIEALPVSALQLRLVGTIAAGPEASLAIIENRGRTQMTYALGDEIDGGVTLYAVQEQRVVLLNKGRQEVLEMLKGAAAVPVGSTGGTTVTSALAGRTPVGGGVTGGQDSAIRRINDNLRVINNEQFQREYGADIVQTVASVRTQPRFVGGNPSGVTLEDLGSGNTLEALGFEVGDVVVSINGQRVNSDQDLARLAETLSTASDIRVQVIRNNLPRTLIYKVR